MNTEIYIEDYRLDITTEISALLNFAIDDIKDFSARSTTWSRTIVLPGTANNNKIFGHIYQPARSNEYDSSAANVNYNFNAAKSADCIIFQDQIQTFKGVLRLLQINIIKGVVEYEVSVFGKLAGLNVALSGGLIESLDFSAYDHVYNDANIVASWDNPGGSGYYYPLIDYGTYSTLKHDWDIRTFRPGLYAREYIDKMITAAGFRWDGALLDTPRFKSQIIPHNQKFLTRKTSILLDATRTTPRYALLNSSGGPVSSANVPWENITGSSFTPSLGNTRLTWNDPSTVTVTINVTISGTYFSDSSEFNFYLIKNGLSIGNQILPSNFSGAEDPYSVTISTTTQLNQNDYLEFNIQLAPVDGWILFIDAAQMGIESTGATSVVVNIGDTVTINDAIPKNIRQIDFLVGLVKLFNLYVYEDKFDTSLIHLTPYIDYYSKNTSNAVDWTLKLNHNKAIKIKPMSELNAKVYKFKFKGDSDYYNDLYRKRYNEGYGDRIYDSEFEFTQQEKSFELVFSATPLVGYIGEEKVYSTIFKQTGNAPTATEENIDSNIRILLTKKITGVASWQIKNGATVLNTLTRYGYAGHFDDPDAPTNDLNFGVPRELFFILTSGSLSNNQFNVYWSGYMAEITDRNSKLVTASFKLTVNDILNLDFSKYIYVDGVAYRLNAIKDYNATTPDDCVVELFRVNAPSYSEAPGNDGPPLGCYLLWSDEQTLDWDDDEPIQYSSCQDNPGDGEEDPDPPNTLSWSFQRIGFLSWGSINIYVDDVLTVSSTAENDSGVFDLVDGQEIRVVVSSYVNRQKRIFVSNSVDGMLYDQTTTGTPTHTHTFTIEADKDYTVHGSINIPLS